MAPVCLLPLEALSLRPCTCGRPGNEWGVVGRELQSIHCPAMPNIPFNRPRSGEHHKPGRHGMAHPLSPGLAALACPSRST